MTTYTALVLDRGQKSRASRAIEGVHAAYYEADGIQALEQTIATKRAAAAKHVYALAVFATESVPKDREGAIALYLALCEHAEESYKAHHKVTDLSEALPTWKTFKSNILTGMRDYELDPREHRSEGAFRTAKAKAKSAAPTLPPVPQDSANVITLRIPRGETLAPAAVNDLLAPVIPNDTLRGLLADLVHSIESLKRSKAGHAETFLRAALAGIQPLADKRHAA